jgi:hypothetical protein
MVDEFTKFHGIPYICGVVNGTQYLILHHL